jgi:putative transposase
MPFICIYIHFVWTTKNREPFLMTPDKRREVWKHIRQYGHAQGIHVDFVGGWIDHCHCLVSMKATQSTDSIMQLLKGESARFINQQMITDNGFGWQDGYYAATVPFGRVNQVREYIKHQETHHQGVDLISEYELLLREMGFQSVALDFR